MLLQIGGSKITFEDTFSKEISSILSEFLCLEETFLQFNLLNKNFSSIMRQLQNYPRLWKNKYLQEFICSKDKQEKYYSSSKDEDRFMKLF